MRHRAGAAARLGGFRRDLSPKLGGVQFGNCTRDALRYPDGHVKKRPQARSQAWVVSPDRACFATSRRKRIRSSSICFWHMTSDTVPIAFLKAAVVPVNHGGESGTVASSAGAAVRHASTFQPTGTASRSRNPRDGVWGVGGNCTAQSVYHIGRKIRMGRRARIPLTNEPM